MSEAADHDIDLAMTGDQRLLAESVGKFIAAEVPPLKLRDLVETAKFPRDLWVKFSALGVHGLLVPEVHGGAGLALADLVIVAETCGAAALPLPTLSHAIATLALTSSKQAAKYLPSLASGERLATVGFLDTDSIDVGWVERGDAADVIVVVGPGDVIRILDRSEGTAAPRGENSADITRLCFAVALGSAPKHALPPGAAARVRDAYRVLLAADAWGIGHRFIESVRDYALTRETFGRKIGEYQSIKHPLADMAVVHAFAQMPLRHAARLWDANDGESGELAALVKAHITDEVVGMARQGIEMKGAFGFTWEGGDHLWFKRAMFDSIHLGGPMELRREIAASRGWNDPNQDRTLTRMWRRKL